MNRRVSLLLLMALFICSALPAMAQGQIQEQKGTLLDVFKSFRGRIIPGYSELYVPPTDADIKQMQELVSEVMISASSNDTANLSESAIIASKIGFEVTRLTNGKTGDIYYILREVEGQNKGWGIYIFRAGNESSDLVIEAPHPIFDLHTERIGILAFENSRAKAFLLAGAHRYSNADGSADVSHADQSMFEAVHEAVTTPSTTVINIHGFASTKEQGYPQIILSSGNGTATLPIKQLSSILETKNFTVGIADGGNLRELEAASDMQGKQTNSIGATFIHIELESSIRNYPSEYRKVVAAISEFDSKYSGNPGAKRYSILNATSNNRISQKEPVARFLNQMKRELWYYITATFAMIGAFMILLLERRKSKI